MTTYSVTAVIGTTYISEIIQLDTNLSSEDELQLAENTLLDKWANIFKYNFDQLADEVTSFTIPIDNDK
jgi:hypothetical protein